MAFRATSHWKSMLTRLGQNRSFASVTTPKFAPSLGNVHAARPNKKYALTGDFAPVFIVMGMVTAAVCIGLHTVKQQLMHSPGVNITKKRRESVLELEDPDVVVANVDSLLNKSFLRKLAHIQDDKPTLPDPSSINPFTRPREAETLKTVGVNPRNT